ncbi:MAG: serine/threonine protein kinase [Deltaproteobacteria bacterium]|nr:MAG: serine/threonine protein kinase [Deltaproteobacteria bacterium]
MVKQVENAVSSKLLEGRKLGGYRLNRLVGKGGMGWVFHAFHEQLQVNSAVKILFPQLAEDEHTRERFLREARIQYQLHHPNIVRVVSLLDEGGYVGFASDWCSGGDLHQWLNARNDAPVSSGELRTIALPLLDALSLAHTEGIVHRDLKLSNIMLAAKGGQVTPKVTDFGIAKHAAMPGITSSGAVMGTLGYMAPEQLHESKSIDHRADIYSFGVILYVLLSGRFPFEGEGPSIMFRILENEPPPIPNIPEEAHEIVQRCLRKDPDERFSTCKELADALRGCLDPEVPISVEAGSSSSSELPSGPISVDMSPAAFADTHMGHEPDLLPTQDKDANASGGEPVSSSVSKSTAAVNAERVARVLQSSSKERRSKEPLKAEKTPKPPQKVPKAPTHAEKPVYEPEPGRALGEASKVSKAWRLLALVLLLIFSGLMLIVIEPDWLKNYLAEDSGAKLRRNWVVHANTTHTDNDKGTKQLRTQKVRLAKECADVCSKAKSCSFFVTASIPGKPSVTAKPLECRMYQGKPKPKKAKQSWLFLKKRKPAKRKQK